MVACLFKRIDGYINARNKNKSTQPFSGLIQIAQCNLDMPPTRTPGYAGYASNKAPSKAHYNRLKFHLSISQHVKESRLRHRRPQRFPAIHTFCLSQC